MLSARKSKVKDAVIMETLKRMVGNVSDCFLVEQLVFQQLFRT